MNLKPLEIHQAIASQREDIAAAITRAITSATEHHRKAVVTVKFTAAHDKDSPGVLVVTSVLKVKEPRGPRIDVTGTSEECELLRMRTDEESGQESIGGGEA